MSIDYVSKPNPFIHLPDTADELRSIALALEADPTKALHLGRDANEQLVKKTDLSGFKIVAFATHGLAPGELDGLDQPALALSAPAVAAMQEILALNRPNRRATQSTQKFPSPHVRPQAQEQASYRLKRVF